MVVVGASEVPALNPKLSNYCRCVRRGLENPILDLNSTSARYCTSKDRSETPDLMNLKKQLDVH